MRRPLAASLLALLVGGTTAGCSSDGYSSSSGPPRAPSSGPPAVCSSVTELQSSVADLQSVPVVQQGVAALESAFATVRSDVAQVVDDGKAQFRSQTEGLSTDLAAVQTAVSAATSTPDRCLPERRRHARSAPWWTTSTALADDVSSTC